MSKLPSRSLKNYWYLFLIGIGVSGVAFYGLDSALTRLKPSEQLSLFLLAESFQEEKIASLLNEKKPDTIVAMEEHFVVSSNSSLSTLYSAYGPGVSDLLLLPESQLSNSAPQLAVLQDSVLLPYFDSGLTYWSYGGVNYGILSHQHTSSSQTLVGYSTTEDYYLCFSASSVQIGSLNGSSNDAALKLGKSLLNL